MRKTKSAILQVVHDTAEGLFRAGAIDQILLREFELLCLTPVEPPHPQALKSRRARCAKPRGTCPADRR